MGNTIGPIAFIIGFIIAILAGFLNIPYLAITLAILGFVVGFMNITGREAGRYLMASIALMVAGTATLSVLPGVGGILARIFENIIFFVASGTVIVAFRTLFKLSKD